MHTLVDEPADTSRVAVRYQGARRDRPHWQHRRLPAQMPWPRRVDRWRSVTLQSRPQPVRYPRVTWGCLVKGQSYTGAGRAASVSVACSPGVSGVSAVLSPMAAGLAGREVQRPVHAHVSRQYQRKSGQSLPPSATIWSAGKRMPHIQQDLALACSAQYRTERSWSVTACSPGRLSTRAVVAARGAGTFTGAAGASNGGCSRPAAHSASGSSGRSPISDAPASYGQPVVMCTPSPSVRGHLVYPGACARRRGCPPPTGDRLTRL
jgi:hypothetical protein